ncbi:MAG: SseB family protein [Verrucomicrobia bacterium]|nr:SseB family protein [Verrucomicrobiota bacterium]
METITLQQLQEMFAGLRNETDWNLDGEMLWGYYFVAPAPEVLESLAETLSERNFDISEIFKSDDEPIFILQAERLEKHTPESLFALNAELEALAAKFEGVDYDGMDVNPADEECDCEGDCENCDCEEEEEHQCGCGSEHCHSENEPIENPEIVAAIQKIAEDASEEAQQDLTLELQRGLYLVPVFAESASAAQAEEGSMQVLVCMDENEKEFLPLFTDEAALKGWTKEKVSAMVLTAPEAWEFILSQPECAGAVVNPGDVALPLNREMVALLKKMIDEIEAGSGE